MKKATLTKRSIIRFTPQQWANYEAIAYQEGFSGVAAMLRFLADKHCKDKV